LDDTTDEPVIETVQVIDDTEEMDVDVDVDDTEEMDVDVDVDGRC